MLKYKLKAKLHFYLPKKKGVKMVEGPHSEKTGLELDEFWQSLDSEAQRRVLAVVRDRKGSLEEIEAALKSGEVDSRTGSDLMTALDLLSVHCDARILDDLGG